MADWLVGNTSEVSEGRLVPVQVHGKKLVIGRSHGRYFAFEDKCPHAGAPLSLGHLEGNSLQCAKHGWKFDVFSAQSLPEQSAFCLNSFAVRVDGEKLYVALEA